MPVAGAPIGPDHPTQRDGHCFDHVPRLRELLPNGGWVGVTYAQVLVRNLKDAYDRVENPAHLRPIQGTTYYAIEGPKGVAQMALVGCGEVIPDGSPDSGERLFFTDAEVETVTGLPVGDYPISIAREHVAPRPRAAYPDPDSRFGMPQAGPPELSAGEKAALMRKKQSEKMKAMWAEKKAAKKAAQEASL